MGHHSKMQLFLSIPNYQHSRVIFKLKSFRQWRRCQHLGIDGKAIPRPRGNTVAAKQHEVLPTSEPTRSFSSPTGEPSGEPAPLLPVSFTRIISLYHQAKVYPYTEMRMAGTPQHGMRACEARETPASKTVTAEPSQSMS
jgi:hypothetical protein